MTAPDDPRAAFRPQLLDERGAKDRVTLAELRADDSTTVLDRVAAQRAELGRVLPAVAAELLDEPGRWTYYPWRRTVVSVLGPDAFRRLRLDRNRNKITSAEQRRCGRLAIGVVGLSVGHAIAHTLALEGLCGQLRLADFDAIELSNLNRIPATLLDLGLNKAVAAARHIAELDPYLPLTVYPDGVTPASIPEFLDGLDLVIEECDSLDLKFLIRQEARARGIPVVMVTSDRGLLDVERFDLEPGRPLLHGLCGELVAQDLAGLSTNDTVPPVLQILEPAGVSARMAASMIEVGRTTTTWPQLAGDVLLDAASVAAAVRRFGRGEELASGRVRIDLEAHLDQLGPPAALAAAAEPDVAVEPVGEAGSAAHARRPAEPVEAVVHALRLAPSGGNVQPWSVAVEPGAVRIYLAQERTSAMDVQFRGSYVAIGAALHNVRVAAAAHGILGPVEIGDARLGTERLPAGPVATLHFGSSADPALAGQYRGMLNRGTNRHFGVVAPIEAPTRTELSAAALRGGGQVRLVTERASVAACADIIAASDRIRYLTPLLHGQMMSELSRPGRDRLDRGIDVRTLELDAADLARLEVVRRPDVMAVLAEWDAGGALGEFTRDRVNSSSALAVVTVDGATPADYVRGGGALEEVWICAEQHGLAIHPVSPVFLFASDGADFEGLSPRYAAVIAELRRAFLDVVGIASSQSLAAVVRMSHAPPRSMRSQRLSLEAIRHVPRAASTG